MQVYSLKIDLKETTALYSEALQKITENPDHRYSTEILGGAHIVRTRISSLEDHVRSSKPALLSKSISPRFSSRTHEFVNEFVSDIIDSKEFLSRLIEALREQSNVGLMTTNDLWAVPNFLSILLIRKISLVVLEEKYDCGETNASISASHSILAEIQNVLWLEIMPKISCLDLILKDDPSGIFISMDSETKDYYRQSIARIAKLGLLSEKEVASQALALALKNATDPQHELSHVGYYLVGRGAKLICSPRGGINLLLSTHRYSIGIRTAFIVLVVLLFGTTVFTTQFITKIFDADTSIFIGIALWPAVGLLKFTALIASLKYVLNITFNTKRIPRLDYRQAIPVEAKTLVVIPCLLTNRETILRLKERLLMQFLRNRAENIGFALLTDWSDSGSKHRREDLELLAFAIDSVQDLNRHHASGNSSFFLFHRPRQWCAREKVWMGRSRKHGKLIDLNKYLAAKDSSPFQEIVGDLEFIRNVSYVITIDDDTDLSYGAAVRLISALNHPLNKPRLSSDRKKISHGYGLLQPSVSALGFHGNESRYQEIITHGIGIKVYQSSSSDFYTDVLDTGSFIGKGIYDIKCAHALLELNIDSDIVLSHDIIEGGLLNSANISDTELFEPAPRSYGSEMKRQDRWIRGDVQNFFWLITNPRKIFQIGFITSWRVFESLLNHLIEPALLSVALASCGIEGFSWLALGVIGYTFLPPILRSLRKIQSQRASLFNNSFRITLDSVKKDFQMAFLKFSTLPHRALVTLIALTRSFYRYFISGNYLLEWTTFEQSENLDLSNKINEVFLSGIVFSSFCILTSFKLADSNVLAAALFSTAWLASAYYVHFLNSCPAPEPDRCKDDFLHLAWRTWNYFDQAFKVATSKIVPDNLDYLQIDRRSSPTNIGMSLVAIVSANKLSLISRSTSLTLLGEILESITALPKYQGHLYNWYDIDTLSVIGHGSISSADSANFIASVTVIKEWLKDSRDENELKAIAETYLKLSYLLQPSDIDHIMSNAANSLRLLFEKIVMSGIADVSGMQDLIDSSSTLSNKSEIISAMLHGVKECLKTEIFSQNKFNIDRLLQICRQLTSPSFSFFLNTQAGLLHIERYASGHNESPALYDMLASEARLSTFIGIAKSDLYLDSWTRLSRSKMSTTQGPCLISWNGSLFEHLFAELFAMSPRGTLLDLSNRNVVKKSIEAANGLPWGKSECACFDALYGGIYGPVGEPELSISREKRSKKIIAPYASMLAINLETPSVIMNFHHLCQLGALGNNGLFESISLDNGIDLNCDIMRRHYSHHQGMILASIANSSSGAITNLFFKDHEMRAASFLLREPWPDNFILINR
ncbi:hypothetical protein JWH04_07930 [Xanthomonas melonis]|uniref:glucoamylase family protein n=1 Tax=Xanthomonas melonis TaxID=56456 RepID=UPI001E358177|nr:DUF3131 domain-containing protein [Xanthomonas melonis]MCD0278870.1 hypothetical protein [Xanthomonas melonis]